MTELTEAQKRYNKARYELFQLGAYGHCTYTNGEMLTEEGQRQQQDYNDRLRSAGDELEAALLHLVADHVERNTKIPLMSTHRLRKLADDPEELAELATPEGEEPVIVAYADPGVPEVRLCVKDAALWDPTGVHMTPLTSEDLPTGGICTHCGVDVLIPQLPSGSALTRVADVVMPFLMDTLPPVIASSRSREIADATLYTPSQPGLGLAIGLERAAEIAEDVSEELRKHQEFERSNGALDVMSELRRQTAGEKTSD